MTPELTAALDEFLEDVEELEEPVLAYKKCSVVSKRLVRFLGTRGYQARLLHWWADNTSCDPGDRAVLKITRGDWAPTNILAIFERGTTPWWSFSGHTAVLVSGFGVDFTARQFGADVPFPLVWKHG